MMLQEVLKCHVGGVNLGFSCSHDITEVRKRPVKA